MKGKKQTTTTTTVPATPIQVVPQDTADINALRGWKPQLDPTIASRFNRRREEIKSGFNNPFGSYTTPLLREQQQDQMLNELGQEEGNAMRAGSYDMNNQSLAKLSTLAGLTAPQIFSGGGTTTSTTQMPGQSPWQTVGQVGLSALSIL